MFKIKDGLSLGTTVIIESDARISWDKIKSVPSFALIDSPAFTGTPTAPTAASGTNTTQLATTAFVKAAVDAAAGAVTSFNTRTGAVTLSSADVTNALAYTPTRSASGVNSFVSLDTRDTNYEPQARGAGLYADFKNQSTIGLKDGDYAGLLTYRSYGNSTDLSGGPVHQLSFTRSGKMFQRISTSTTAWSGWKEFILADATGNVGLGITPSGYGLHQLGGGIRLQAVATPAAPTVTNVGTTGTTTYTYFVVAEDRNGKKTLASASTSTTTGHATLDATNYNTVSWSAVTGAVKYYVLKTNTGTLLGSTTGTSLNDQGQATSAFTTATRNETADVIVDGAVLIGKTTSDGANKLQVLGRAGITSGLYDATVTTLHIQNDGDATARVRNSYDTVVIQQPDAPTIRLAETGESKDVTLSLDGGVSVLGTSNTDLVFATGRTYMEQGWLKTGEKMRIANGNLLIGTTVDNGAKLQVAGNADIAGTVKVPANDSGRSFETRNTSATGAPVQFYVEHSLGDTRIGNARGALFVPSNVLLEANAKISPRTTNSRQSGMYGIYDPAKTHHIWSIGTAYAVNADGVDFGNLYGLAYKHTNNATGGNMAGGHQMVWCDNGNPQVAIGSSGLWTKAGAKTLSSSHNTHAADGNGLRFWDSSAYTIYMSAATNGTWGGRVAGETTSDYNIYFRMTGGGTNRGFVFQTNNGRVAGIDGGGTFRTVGNISGGGINPAKGLHLLGGGALISSIATPAAPTVANVGTTGTTTYNYYIIAEDRNGGRTLISPVGSTTTGHATLDTVNYNTISWTAVAGATKYLVMKGGSGTLLGTTTGTSLNDQGQATTAHSYVGRNTTADAVIDGQLNVGQQVHGGEVFTHNWFRNHNNNTGLYNQANASHWYSDGNGFWNASTGSSTTYPRIVLRSGHGGAIRGSFYSDANGSGLLNNGGSWGVRLNYGGDRSGGTLYGNWNVDSPGAFSLPVGTNAQRPSGVAGDVRFNSDLKSFEGHNGTAWDSIGGGAKGGVGNSVFYENDTTITQSYTIGTNKNAMTAGPITIADGVVVTVPDGSVWTVV